MAKYNDRNFLNATYGELAEFENFFTDHWKNIIAVGVIIVVLVAAGIQIKIWLDKHDSKTASALISANTIEELESALKKHPRHKVADYAKLQLGALYFESGDYQKAGEIFAELAEKSKSKELAAQAALNNAAVLLQKGKTDDAAQKYSSIGQSNKYPANYRVEAKISAALLYIKLGKSGLAKHSLEISDLAELEFANSNPNYQRAQTRLLSAL